MPPKPISTSSATRTWSRSPTRTSRRIAGSSRNVEARFQGGRAGEGDLEQVRERVEAADRRSRPIPRRPRRSARHVSQGRRHRAVQSADSRAACAACRRRRTNRSRSRCATTRPSRPREADKDAAQLRLQRHRRRVPAQRRVRRPRDARLQHRHDPWRPDRHQRQSWSTWDIFRGGQDIWRRAEFAERYEEQTMRHARLQREAFELIDKAWAARTITNDRIAALTRQIAADRRVIDAYNKEYELGQRSLIDLLNAYNQLFNARVSLESTRGTAVFADYQLLAAMGQLLAYLKAPTPVDAEPLQTQPFGIFPISCRRSCSAPGAWLRAAEYLGRRRAWPVRSPPRGGGGDCGSMPRPRPLARMPRRKAASSGAGRRNRACPGCRSSSAVRPRRPSSRLRSAPASAGRFAADRHAGPCDFGPDTSAFAPNRAAAPAWLASARVNRHVLAGSRGSSSAN